MQSCHLILLPILGYRLGTSGYTYPGNNVGGNEAKEVETDCFALCRQEAGCLGWGFYWLPDRSELKFFEVLTVYIGFKVWVEHAI